MLTLYGYFRSSAAYRVRIALNYKDIDYDQQFIHLVRDGGQQFSADYKKINPQSLVPTLIKDNKAYTQSLAIIEYLEEKYPEPALLPPNAEGKSQVRALAQIIACDIHPLNNRRVLKYFSEVLHLSEDQQHAWIQHWIQTGFSALEKMLMASNKTNDFCYGATPTMADICLIPQMYNAQRFNCPLDDYPILSRINENCLKLPAFQKAHPSKQPDVE
jgi:maleylacetoacetate isomerase